MRRLVVALFVALLALSLVGCGGGGEEAPPAEEVAPPPEAAAPAPIADPANPIADRSAEESVTFEPFPAGEDIPASVSERISEKQPMVMLFIDDEQKDSDDLADEVEIVADNNRGLFDLLTYDIGKYSTVNKNGTVRVDADALNDDEKAQESIMLARALDVTFAPYVVIVDDQGYIIYRHSGFVDSDLMERQVLRVTD